MPLKRKVQEVVAAGRRARTAGTSAAARVTSAKRTAPGKAAAAREEEPVLGFPSPEAWGRWLAKHHATSRGLWLKLEKKQGTRAPPLTYAQALDEALAWGWIDSQKRALDAQAFLQRFTPRTARSPWSKINRAKVDALVAAGRMQPPGLAEVERARADGRWAAAYDGARTSVVPPDLEAALAASPRARAFFAQLDGANRYAILYRVQTVKRPETRARRIAELVAMCARHETVHPVRRKG